MRALPELITMIKGMRVASRAVASSLLMLSILVYVFAIVVHMFLKDEESVYYYFADLPTCMWTLLVDGTFQDSLGPVTRDMLAIGSLPAYVSTIVFMAFVLLSSMTVMNMLVGVLCEVVSAVAHSEKEAAAVAMIKGSLLLMLKRIDTDGSGEISYDEMQTVMHDPHANEVLQSMQVDITYLMEIIEMIFEEPDKNLSIPEVMEMLLDCRGDRPATLKDLIDSQTFTRWYLGLTIERGFEHLHDSLAEIGSRSSNTAFKREAQERASKKLRKLQDSKQHAG